MTFEEATENINVLSSFSTLYGISPKVVQDIINSLKQEYAPTIEMTSEEKEGIITGLKYKNEYNSPFANFSETYRRINQNWGDRMYINLTEEQLMQAWLNPEVIRVLEE